MNYVNLSTTCTMGFSVIEHFDESSISSACDIVTDFKSIWISLRNPLTRIINWTAITRERSLDPGTLIKILSFVLAFGLFSVAMIIAVAFHLLCFEERKPTVKAVLQRQNRLKNIDYTLVWHSRYRCYLLWWEIPSKQMNSGICYVGIDVRSHFVKETDNL